MDIQYIWSFLSVYVTLSGMLVSFSLFLFFCYSAFGSYVNSKTPMAHCICIFNAQRGYLNHKSIIHFLVKNSTNSSILPKTNVTFYPLMCIRFSKFIYREIIFFTSSIYSRIPAVLWLNINRACHTHLLLILGSLIW